METGHRRNEAECPSAAERPGRLDRRDEEPGLVAPRTRFNFDAVATVRKRRKHESRVLRNSDPGLDRPHLPRLEADGDLHGAGGGLPTLPYRDERPACVPGDGDDVHEALLPNQLQPRRLRPDVARGDAGNSDAAEDRADRIVGRLVRTAERVHEPGLDSELGSCRRELRRHV